MLLQEGDTRSIDVDIRLAVSLAAVAGAINAAAFRAVGLFSGNMTGNVSSLSNYIAAGSWGIAPTFVVVVIAFVLGAFTSTILIEAGRRRELRGVFAYSIMAEGVCLGLLGIANLTLPGVHSTPLLVIGLSFLMGVQNATTTLISNARVRTTHVSGMATDMGIEIALLASGRPLARRPEIQSRLRLHATSLLAFLVGGISGVVAYIWVAGGVFLLCAIILIILALPFVRAIDLRKPPP